MTELLFTRSISAVLINGTDGVPLAHVVLAESSRNCWDGRRFMGVLERIHKPRPRRQEAATSCPAVPRPTLLGRPQISAAVRGSITPSFG